MRVSVVVLLSLAVVFGAASVAAQEGGSEYVQLVNEYFLTASVYPQERGEVQLTAFPRVEFEEGLRSVFPLALELGLTDRWQIEAEWVSLAVNRPDGLPGRSGTGDFELDTQYSFMNVAGSSTHVAVGFGVTIPSGSTEAGGSAGETELQPSISVGRDLWIGSRPSQIFGQVALGLVREKQASPLGGAGSDAHELFLGVGYIVAAGHVRWTAEVSWASNEWNGGDESELHLAPGLILDLPDTWELGIGAPIGIGGNAGSFGLSLFLLYEFELDDEQPR